MIIIYEQKESDCSKTYNILSEVTISGETSFFLEEPRRVKKNRIRISQHLKKLILLLIYPSFSIVPLGFFFFWVEVWGYEIYSGDTSIRNPHSINRMLYPV